MSELQKSVLRSRITGALPPIASRTREAPIKKDRQKNYTPGLWSEHFAEKRDVRLDEKHVFRVYLTGPPAETGPVIVLLHGGGYSALTWSQFSEEITGSINCQCLAIDLRGHGDSIVEDEDDLAATTLANDVANVLLNLYPECNVPIMLVGHSMGGAIACHIAHMELVPSLIGCVVIDVVEGTAMEALTSMQSFLRSRPTHFRSIQHAIEWSIRSGQIRNVDSAKISVPGQIMNCSTGLLATNELPLTEDDQSVAVATPSSIYSCPDTIDEDAEFNSDSAPTPPASTTPLPAKSEVVDTKKYTWRIDLAKSEQFWSGWFCGLSHMFLDLRVPKLLILASIDGLDRTLTVGQMQGKFQLRVLARCGHVVHEDRPHEVAEVIASYMVRNKFATPIGEFHAVFNSMPC